MAEQPSKESMQAVERLVGRFAKKSGTVTHPSGTITDGVKLGLANNIDKLRRPLCPCRFYPDKMEEVQHRTWICPCEDMQVYKYCHCLLFVREDGMPITEYLPEAHEGRKAYGIVIDPTPDKGRARKDRAEDREVERRRRRS